jgi:hypothetical protein
VGADQVNGTEGQAEIVIASDGVKYPEIAAEFKRDFALHISRNK